MKSTLARVLTVLASTALLAGLVPTAAGAAVTPPKAKAKVDVHQVLAGAERAFTLTVSNPIGSAGRITSVRVGVTVDLLTIAAPIDAPGWSEVVKNGFVTYTAEAGGGIPIGASRTFGLTADAQRPAFDRNAAWSVSTSTDPGVPAKYTAAEPTGAGALGTRVRTLEVLDITTVAPDALVGDDAALYVTAGQDNITMSVRVNNAGSAAQTATVALTGANATTEPATVALAPGEIASVPIDVSIGDAIGHGKVVASAVAGPSIAATKFRAYVAEAPLRFVVEDLRPWEVAPGTERSFRAVLTTSGSAAREVVVDASRSELRLADGGIVAPLTDDLVLTASTITRIESEVVEIPDIADGQYDDLLHLEGVDENGAVVDVDLPFADPLVVDSAIPTVDLTISVDGPAAANGSEVVLGGKPRNGNLSCRLCRLIDVALEVYDADGDIAGVIPADDADNDEGELSGASTISAWPDGAVATRWIGTIVDPSGLSSSAASPLLDVDLLAPAIEEARTVDVRSIEVELSEPVTAPAVLAFAPGDWRCTEATVSRATLDDERDTVQLSLARDLDRDATPSCTYSPQASAAQDRMGYELASSTVVAADGIAPLVPVVDAIEAREAFDGTFHVNTSTPTLSISDVSSGNLVSVYEDLEGDAEALVGSGMADGSTIDIMTSSLGGSDRSLTLLIGAVDTAGNASELAVVPVVLDFTAPALATAAVARVGQTRDVTVAFAEPLVGPAAANDWILYNGAQGYTVSVQISGDTVTLTVSDSAFQPQTMPLNGVAYDVFLADGSTRLTDRAGNILADSVRSF